MAELFELTGKLRAMGPEKVVITGIPQGKFIANYMNQENEEPMLLRTCREGTERCGTGDLFASIIAADAVNGVSFVSSVRKASLFVKKCMIKSMEMGIDRKNGVCFEEILHLLKV